MNVVNRITKEDLAKIKWLNPADIISLIRQILPDNYPITDDKIIDQFMLSMGKPLSQDMVDFAYTKCTRCANCCRYAFPIQLTKDDIKRLSKVLKKPFTKLLNENIIRYDSNNKEYHFSQSPCPLLKDNNCTRYKERPDSCRMYPFIPIENAKGELVYIPIYSYENRCDIVYLAAISRTLVDIGR